jgi:hypothetical protein
VGEGDRWLAGVVPKIIASPAWRKDGVLLVTWDEDDGRGDNRVLTLVIAPKLARKQTSAYYDHYSLLALVEDRLRVPRLGKAASAQPFPDLF